MTSRAVLGAAMAIALSASTACQTTRPIGDDFSHALSSPPNPAGQSMPAKRVTRGQSTAAASASPPPSELSPVATGSPATASVEPPFASGGAGASESPPAPTAAPDPAIRLAGMSEGELRAVLGAPSEEQERPPGKRWRYREGQCTLDVQLYPDVGTRQFRALAHEVSSDDRTDRGRRLCLGQIQARVLAGH